MRLDWPQWEPCRDLPRQNLTACELLQSTRVSPDAMHVASSTVPRRVPAGPEWPAVNNSEQSDLSLVQLAQRGDAGAFDALVRRYQHKVVKLVLRYVRDPAEAEDIAQEAFIKAYRALPRFRGDSAFYTWLYRIAINTAKNALAARGRSPLSFEIDRPEGEESSEVLARMKDTATPEAMALTEEIRSIVTAAIEALPEDLRTAIQLRELEGMSYEEIANAMECPVGTVRSRIFRAREAIDARLREVFEGGLGRGEALG